jgi:hypothetical protein
MRILAGRQQFKVSWEDGSAPSWVYSCQITHTEEATDAMAEYNCIDELDAGILANDRRANALLEAEPLAGDRVIVQRKSASFAAKVMSRDGDALHVLADGSRKQALVDLADVMCVAPTAVPEATVGKPVRAVYTSEERTGRHWFYGTCLALSRGRELVTIKFDDKSTMTVPAFDVQDAQTGAWL